MSTKIILTVVEGLSHQEMDDLRYLLADAISEFAVRRTPPADYVNRCYPVVNTCMGMTRADKVRQVERRIALATKLHPSTLLLDYEHTSPHKPTPILHYYKICGEDDLPAMTAALEFLPASQYGERKGWVVLREGGTLIIHGPEGQRAFWTDVDELDERWMWIEESVSPGVTP